MKTLGLFIAQGLGSGRLPYAPGTWGTLAFLLVGWGLLSIEVYFQWLFFVLLVLLSFWSIPIAGEILDETDHSSIVIDEWSGCCFTILGVSYILDVNNGFIILLSFFAFRFLDIIKPWPISWAENRFSGSFGVLFDDLLAGLGVICLTSFLSPFL